MKPSVEQVGDDPVLDFWRTQVSPSVASAAVAGAVGCIGQWPHTVSGSLGLRITMVSLSELHAVVG